MKPAPRTLLVGLLFAVGACTSFQDVTTVTDLRVLGIDVEPSEIILSMVDPTADPPFDPASNPQITVKALLPDPTPGAGPVTWTMVGCPNNPYGASPPSGGAPGMIGGGARTTVGSSTCAPDGPRTWTLSSDPVAADGMLSFTLSAQQLRDAAMSDFYVDQFGNLHGGVDLGMPINLQLTASDGLLTVSAIKRVLFWLTGPKVYWPGPLDPGQTPNRTPVIPGVRAYRQRDPDTFAPVEPVLALDEAAPETLHLGEELWVEPVMPAGTAEPYWTAVIDAATHLAVPLKVDKERIRYAFYATAGKFDPARTASELPVGFVGTPHLESKYTPPGKLDDVPAGADGRAQVTIWIVVRDERGGESWVQRQLALEP